MLHRWTRDLRIGHKFILLAMVTSGIAMLLVGVALLGADRVTQRTRLVANLATLAEITAGNEAGALVFEDSASSSASLSALQADRHVLAAVAYVRDGRVLATYRRDGNAYVPPAFRTRGVVYGPNQVRVFRPAAYKGEPIGAIMIESDLDEIQERTRAGILIVALALLLALGASWALASGLQRFISLPVRRLTQAAQRVRAEGNYSLRLDPGGSDEIGSLIGDFNAMLAEVEARDRALERHKDRLETDVADRTAELRAANEALRASRDKAEEASRVKSEFLANMSHEIRTPLNGVIGMTELVLDTTLTPDQRECLQTVTTSADTLLAVINDILDFSKIEAGHLALDPVEFSLRETLERTTRTLALRAHEKGLELACRVAPDVPERIVGDAVRLGQVVLNLVSNAVKFTHVGEVDVSVELDGIDRETCDLHFRVSDSGIGIPPEKQPLIFEAFMQADGSTTRRFGGTGLGLAIASRLVTLMGGSIWVESAVGQGSVFHFTARVPHAAAADGGTTPATPELRGMRVLVVDDHATNRRILQELLGSWGMKVLAVDSGDAALGALAAAAHVGSPFGLTVLDGHMPRMDGFQLAARIEQDYPGTRPVLLMLTSGVSPNDGAKARAMGIASCLTKPIVRSELLATIRSVLHVAEAPGPAASEGGRLRAMGRCLEVLIAEDNAVNQKVIARLLRRLGHDTTVVENGEEALKAITAKAYDLVLMDIQMPVLGGVDATRAIRARERFRGGHIPIVALTAHALKGDREQCLEAGMDDYLPKPVRADDVIAAIRRVFPRDAWLDLAEGDGDVPAPAVDAIDTGSETARVADARAASFPLERAVSEEALAAQGDAGAEDRARFPAEVGALSSWAGIDGDQACALLRSALEQAQEREAELRDALREERTDRAQDMARRLAGFLAGMSLSALGRSADRLVSVLDGDRSDAAREILAELSVERERLQCAIEAPRARAA